MSTSPSSSTSPQPEKLPPPVLGSGAPALDKTVATDCLTQAYEEEMGQHLDAKAQSGLACIKTFGPRLGKAHVSAKLGNPFKPIVSGDLGQGSLRCLPCLRKGIPAPTPATNRTPQMEASSPVVETSPPHPPPPSKPTILKVSFLYLRFPQEGSSLLLLLFSGIRGLRGKGDPVLVLWNRCQGRLKLRRIPCP